MTSQAAKLVGRKVLVTGGAGFIGSHLVDGIIADQPSEVIVVDDLTLGSRANLESARRRFPSLQFHHGDASDLSAMSNLVRARPVDVLFQLAVIPLPASLVDPWRTVATNVALAMTGAELVRRGLCRTLIHVSSSEAYGTATRVPMAEDDPLHPLTPYAASKAAGDHIVLSYVATWGIDAAIVRPFNTYGPRQNAGNYAGIIPIVIRQALRGETVTIHGDGRQTRDFLFVRDTVDATIRAYEEPATRGRVINVASGAEVSINDLVKKILGAVGATARVVHGPARPGDVRRHLGDTTLARELLGFQPRVALTEGLAATVAWYRALDRTAVP